jgi:flagellar export protein FliJ
VADVSARREQETAQDLANTCRRLDKQLEQLQQLYAFREDYTDQACQRAASGSNGHTWELYSDFLRSIGDLIACQERALAQTGDALNSRRSEWQRASQRSTVIKELLQRAERYLKGRDERRQQNEVDDQSAKPRRRR